MKLDEQLFRNYNELHAMIKQCYRNVAILEAYKIIQKENQDIYASTQDISNYSDAKRFSINVMENIL